MMQFSYVSMGARNMRKLGGQFMNGVSYLTGQTRNVVSKSSVAARGAPGQYVADRADHQVQAQAMRVVRPSIARTHPEA